MTVNWKRGLLLGFAVFLYSLAALNFWPDLNIYLNALLAAIVAVASYKIADVVFEE